MDQSLMHPTAR